MTSLRFPYTRITRHNVENPLLRYKNQPLLDVGLSSKTGQLVKAVAYIDTGAQWCLFNNQYAKELGFKDYKSEESFPLSGIGGSHSNTAYFHDLDLIIFTDYKKLTLKKSITIPTKIGFLEKDFGFGAILGVYGFLDHFAFYANIPHHYFELTPIFDTP